MDAVIGVGQKICAVLEELGIQEKAMTVSLVFFLSSTGDPQIVSRNTEFVGHCCASLILGNLVTFSTARVSAVSSRRRNGTDTVSMRTVGMIYRGNIRCSSHNSRHSSEAKVSHWIAHANICVD